MFCYHNPQFCMTCLHGKTLGVRIIVAPTVGPAPVTHPPEEVATAAPLGSLWGPFGVPLGSLWGIIVVL